ncbi:MAG: HEAT repeat domain-containing protein [Gemmataceae bacterium]
MQVALKKILDLLAPANDVEVRRAAVTVLGEVGPRDAAVHDAVLAALGDDDGEVRLRAIAAAGKLRVEKALPSLTERIRAGGPEAVRAAEVAARLGAKGRKLLHELMPHVAPGLRRYIASALAGAGVAGTGDVKELEILLDKDPAVVQAAVASLSAAIPGLDAGRRRALADELLRLAGDPAGKLSPAAEAGVIRLAGLLNDDRAAPLLWDRVLPPHPPEARANALAALGRWVQSPSKEQRHRLIRCACDQDFRVAAPALMILDKLPAPDKAAAEWLPLFRSPGLAGRRLALTKVGGRDDADVAETLLGQLGHPDRAYREEVLARLSQTDRGRKALAVRLAAAETTDAAWPLARVLAPFVQADPEAWIDEPVPQGVEVPGGRRPPGRPAAVPAARGEPRRAPRPTGEASQGAGRQGGVRRRPPGLPRPDPRPGRRLSLPAGAGDVRAEGVGQGAGRRGAGPGPLPGLVRRAGPPGRPGGARPPREGRLAGGGGVVLPWLRPDGVARGGAALPRRRGAGPVAEALPQEQAGGRRRGQAGIRRPGREEAGRDP